jgi:rhodanese-related sulfurtransferase
VEASQPNPVVDVGVREVWARLAEQPTAVLIDVRTAAEWSFVGVPDLSSIGKKPLFIEWLTFPENRVDPGFAERARAALSAVGAATDSELFFLCRSGVRSKAAAQAMAIVGFSRCRNVAEGFEGPLDPGSHRGRLSGWKQAGLPWVQS